MSESLIWSPTAEGAPYTADQSVKDEYLLAKSYFDALQLPQVISGDPHQLVIYVNFDGTGNNKSTNPNEESNVGLLDDQLDKVAPLNDVYEVGVGTTGSGQTAQQALGLGAQQRVLDAMQKVAAEVATAKQQDPDVQPYIVVTGFSRGAAEARMFMTAIDEYGVPGIGDAQAASSLTYDTSQSQFPPGSVHMSAMLFDTVSTSMGDDNFSIPGSVDSVVQITSQDERRAYFPLTSIEAGPDSATNRLIEVQLPGAHSDIGGGYAQNGVSNINLYFAEEVLRDWGVPIGAPTLPDLDSAATWTMHDSRSIGTKIWYMLQGLGLGVPAERDTFYVTPDTPTADEVARLTALYQNISGEWNGLANIPAAIQSPPADASTIPDTGTLPSVSSFSVYEGWVSNCLVGASDAMGYSVDGVWVSGASNLDVLAAAEGILASSSVFSSVWSSTDFTEDDDGTIEFSGQSNFDAAKQILTTLYATSPAAALNTAALFGRAAYGLGVSGDANYEALKASLTALDARFSFVLNFFDNSSLTANVVLADASAVGDVIGTDGNDLIIGFDGDTLHGGSGDDTYVITAGVSESIEDSAGQNTVAFENVSSTSLRFNQSGEAVVLDTGGGYTVTLSNFFNDAPPALTFADGSTGSITQASDGSDVYRLSVTSADGKTHADEYITKDLDDSGLLTASDGSVTTWSDTQAGDHSWNITYANKAETGYGSTADGATWTLSRGTTGAGTYHYQEKTGGTLDRTYTDWNSYTYTYSLASGHGSGQVSATGSYSVDYGADGSYAEQWVSGATQKYSYARTAAGDAQKSIVVGKVSVSETLLASGMATSESYVDTSASLSFAASTQNGTYQAAFTYYVYPAKKEQEWYSVLADGTIESTKQDDLGRLYNYTQYADGGLKYESTTSGLIEIIQKNADGSFHTYDDDLNNHVEAVQDRDASGKLLDWGIKGETDTDYVWQDVSKAAAALPTIPTVSLSSQFTDFRQNFASYMAAEQNKLSHSFAN
ncbi:DUF2235 domain-containing protein [Burkholderia multivorans]|nr:DUF2235 domain-containing protein [Burkholderia multivorans]